MKKSPNANFVIFQQLAIFLAIALVLAAILYAFLTFTQHKSTKSSGNTATSSVNKSSADYQKSLNDQQRKDDVFIINSALKAYYLSNKKVPKSLEELKSNSLTEIPTDPSTKKTYVYQIGSDQKSWSVSATLSDGSTFQAKGP